MISPEEQLEKAVDGAIKKLWSKDASWSRILAKRLTWALREWKIHSKPKPPQPKERDEA